MAKVAKTAAVLTLTQLIAGVQDSDRDQMIARIQAQFDDRAAFEKAANGGNTTIQDKLKGYAAKMAKPGPAGLLLATGVTPEFINRSVAEGKRFNIYAIDKVNDLVAVLNGASFKNQINHAILQSLFKFRAAGMPFTGLAAQAAASDKVKVDKGMTAHLVRHTVAAGTAPTQSSSTMNALQVLGVVTNKASVKFPIWELTEAPVTTRFAELLGAA